jgi:hypothetical protein
MKKKERIKQLEVSLSLNQVFLRCRDKEISILEQTLKSCENVNQEYENKAYDDLEYIIDLEQKLEVETEVNEILKSEIHKNKLNERRWLKEIENLQK